MKIVNPINTRFIDDVAKGIVPGSFIMDKFGANHNLNIAQAADIWTAGEADVGKQIYDYQGFDLPGEEILDINSTSGLDTALGTGANLLLLEGLDANFDVITDIIMLDGANIVKSNKAFLRLYRSFVVSAGATGFNQGVIRHVATTTGYVMGEIEIGKNQTLMALYTVPRNHTALLYSIFASVSKKSVATECDIEGYVRPFGGVFLLRLQRGMSTFGTSHFDIDVSSTPTMIPEKSDIKVRSGITSGSGLAMTAGFSLLLEEMK